jgi:hypothetical protein
MREEGGGRRNMEQADRVGVKDGNAVALVPREPLK